MLKGGFIISFFEVLDEWHICMVVDEEMFEHAECILVRGELMHMSYIWVHSYMILCLLRIVLANIYSFRVGGLRVTGIYAGQSTFLW